jgi:hypothetical protein
MIGFTQKSLFSCAGKHAIIGNKNDFPEVEEFLAQEKDET